MKSEKFFIITGAEGSGKTRVIDDLEEKRPFYRVTYLSTRNTKEKGDQEIGWNEFKKLAEEDQLILSYPKKDYLTGVTYEEISRAVESNKPVVWEVGLKWLEIIKNEYPSSVVILVNGIGIEDLYEHLESLGQTVPAAIALQAKRSNTLNKNWHENVDYIVENKRNESQKAAQRIKEIIEKVYK